MSLPRHPLPPTAPVPVPSDPPLLPRQIWKKLSPDQQQTVFHCLIQACRSLIPPDPHREEVSDEKG